MWDVCLFSLLIVLVIYVILCYLVPLHGHYGMKRCFLPFEPAKKHCYVTGGSSGLGFALAKLLVEAGAHVTIVARRENVLKEAVAELETRRAYENQKIIYISADVSNAESAIQALKQSEKKQGLSVDYVFTCAGASKPGFFFENEDDDKDGILMMKSYASGISLNYLGSVFTAKAAVDSWRKNGKQGKLVLTASTLGILNLVGYSQYCPSKHALSSFAECLRQEFLLIESDIHIYYVSTINSPGLIEEDKTKPRITKEIEGTEASDTSPSARARTLIDGLRKGHFAITSDFLTNLLRIVSIGTIPGHSLLDLLLLPIAMIVAVGFRCFVNVKIVHERIFNKAN